MSDNKVEIDVRLKTDKLEKDFDKVEKSAKSNAKDVADSMDTIEDAMQDVSEKSQTSVKKTESAYDQLTRAVKDQENKVSELKSAYQNVVIEFGAASSEAKDLGGQIKSVSGELQKNKEALKQAADSADKLDKSFEDAGDSSKGFSDVLTGNLVADGIKSAISGLKELHDESMEYRRIMASLESSSKLAGYTAEETSRSYKTLVGVLGDTQTAATTTANLQALNLEQSELNTLIDGAIGSWAKYGDSIPIDGLAESITETARTGQVTGTLADVLNWTAGEEDAFNKQLESTSDETERARKIIDKLTQYGLTDMGKEWQENNKSMMEYNQASDGLSAALADLGETAEPVLTELVEALTEILGLLNVIIPVLESANLTGKKVLGLAETIAEALDGLTDEQKKSAKAYIDQQKAAGKTQNAIDLVNEAVEYAIENTEDHTDAVEDNSEKLEKAKVKLENYGQALGGASSSAGQLFESTMQQIGALDQQGAAYENSVLALDALTQAHVDSKAAIQAEIDATNLKIEELRQEYDNAYNSAYSSITGQLGLFNTMTTETSMSVDEMNGALDAQVAYLDTYSQNMETAVAWGVNQGLLEQLSDGSAESAAILQEIVNAGQEKIMGAGGLNEKFGKVEEGKQRFAKAVGEMKTDYTRTMEELITENESNIEKLNQADKAYESGLNTIQGFINGSEFMRTQIVKEYESLADAAVSAYNRKVQINSPSRRFAKSGRESVQGAIVGTQQEKPKLEKVYRELGGAVLDAYQRAEPSQAIAAMQAAVFSRNAAFQQLNGVVSYKNESRSATGSGANIKTLAKEVGEILADEIRDNMTFEFDQREVGRMVRKVT